MNTEEEGFQPVKSAGRTLDVLETLAAAASPPSLGELSRELGIPKSSLHGILRTMAQRGWVETDSSGLRFGLGLRALRVGSSYVERDDVVSRTRAAMDWLSQELGETVHLGRLDGTDVVYLAKRESKHPLRLYSAIGRRLPAHATGLGKAILGTYSDAELRQMLPAELVQLTSHTITDRDELVEELKRCREQGYAEDDQENSEGIRCYAVPLVWSGGGPTTDAISVSIPEFRLTKTLQEEAVRALLDVERRVDDDGR